MKIHEYQAKQILAKYGVPVPKGGVAITPAEAREIASQLGGSVVIKAQVYAGGRGKGGGIKTAQSPEEAERLAQEIIGMRLVTHQTSAEGVLVEKVLVEEAMGIARELYLGITVDGAAGQPAVVVSARGGVNIEEVASEHPEAIASTHGDPLGEPSTVQVRVQRQGFGTAAQSPLVGTSSLVVALLVTLWPKSR